MDCDMALPLVILISGTGSNLRAIHASIRAGHCDAKITAVVSDRADAQGLKFAAEHEIPTRVVQMRDHPSRAHWDAALADAVAEFQPQLVVLAGFMRIVGAAFIERFEHRIINVHPALLPLFPGVDAPAQAVAARVPISGCTVHVVDAGVDTGPVLAQAVVRLSSQERAQSLHQRIQVAEHQLLPRVIHAISRKQILLGPTPTVHGPDADAEIFFSLAAQP